MADAQDARVAEYRGITVADMTKLRSNARAVWRYLRVEEHLVRRAVAGTPFEGLSGR